MARSRKRPVVLEAFRLGHDRIPDWCMDHVSTNQIVRHGEHGRLHACLIQTLEGVRCGTEGDGIIRGLHGECSPCTAAICADTSEAVDAHG